MVLFRRCQSAGGSQARVKEVLFSSGGDDRWVLERRGFPWVARVYSPPCPWDTHYQFSIKNSTFKQTLGIVAPVQWDCNRYIKSTKLKRDSVRLTINGVVVDPEPFEMEEEGAGIARNRVRGKWRGFRPGTTTRHSQSARVHSIVRSLTSSDFFLAQHFFAQNRTWVYETVQEWNPYSIEGRLWLSLKLETTCNGGNGGKLGLYNSFVPKIDVRVQNDQILRWLHSNSNHRSFWDWQ